MAYRMFFDETCAPVLSQIGHEQDTGPVFIGRKDMVAFTDPLKPLTVYIRWAVVQKRVQQGPKAKGVVEMEEGYIILVNGDLFNLETAIQFVDSIDSTSHLGKIVEETNRMLDGRSSLQKQQTLAPQKQVAPTQTTTHRNAVERKHGKVKRFCKTLATALVPVLILLIIQDNMLSGQPYIRLTHVNQWPAEPLNAKNYYQLWILKKSSDVRLYAFSRKEMIKGFGECGFPNVDVGEYGYFNSGQYKGVIADVRSLPKFSDFSYNQIDKAVKLVPRVCDFYYNQASESYKLWDGSNWLEVAGIERLW